MVHKNKPVRNKNAVIVISSKRNGNHPAKSPPRPRLVEIALLLKDDSTCMRADVDPTVQREYLAAMQAGDEFPPVEVIVDGDHPWLVDGHYRVKAARDAGRTQIMALVSKGKHRDALLRACGANARHGLRRTRKDLAKALATVLRDSKWGKRSDSWVARMVGCDHKTVEAHRRNLGIPKCGQRETVKGTQMDTTGIGRKSRTAGVSGHAFARAVDLNDGEVQPPDGSSPDGQVHDESLADHVPSMPCPCCGTRLSRKWLCESLGVRA